MRRNINGKKNDDANPISLLIRRSFHRRRTLNDAETVCISVAVLVFLDVFLFEAEGFRGVEDEHFHADVARNFGPSEFGDDDHEGDRERDGPDGRLFAENANEGMGDPELI